MSGRTLWFPKDACWWRRGRVIELGQEFGPAGPAVLDWLTCEAKLQGPARDHDGSFKAAYAAVAHGTFIDAVLAGNIVDHAVTLGLLDDFVRGCYGTFTARISGWQNDVERPLAAARQARHRVAKSHQLSPDVTDSNEDRTGQDKNNNLSASSADVSRVFDAWQQSTKKTRAKLDGKRHRLIHRALTKLEFPVDDLLLAVSGWEKSPHHRGDNDRGTVYNELSLLLRDAEKIEYFRDLALGSQGKQLSSAERARRHNAWIAEHYPDE